MARQEQPGFIVGSIPSSQEKVKFQILRLEKPWSLAGALGKYLKGTNLKYVVYFFHLNSSLFSFPLFVYFVCGFYSFNNFSISSRLHFMAIFGFFG